MTPNLIAFDSNVFTFFLEASSGDYHAPARDPLRDQRIAAFRLFLYAQPVILPTVTREAEGIRQQDHLRRHLDSIAFQFNEFLPDEKWMVLIERRARELERFHPGKLNDCQIVAEAEADNVPVLVTFDGDLRRRLTSHAKVRIETPEDCWESMAIPRGSREGWRPAPANPLLDETWWRWD